MAVLLHILGFISILALSIKLMFVVDEDLLPDSPHCTFKDFLVYMFYTISFTGRDSFNTAGKIFGVVFDILSLPMSLFVALLGGIMWGLGFILNVVGDVFERLFLK